MREILASGNAFEVGHRHGKCAIIEIEGSIAFYAALFERKCGMDWETVKYFAMKYQPYLIENFPKYVTEMEGVALGAGLQYSDILALNVRTEIAFGAFNDGCTAFSWKVGDGSLLAQNWDWHTIHADNLICLKIHQDDGLKVQMITEGGIIGKIGLNEKGVGCTLNAIKAKGVSFQKLPVHLALRTVLENESKAAAVAALERAGVASACHILIADSSGGIGLECSSEDIIRLPMNNKGIVTHTNHFILPHHKSVVENTEWLTDTWFRLRRIDELLTVEKDKLPAIEIAERLLADEVVGDGGAICRFAREAKEEDKIATLFSIVMDLNQKKANVIVGRPTESTQKLDLAL